MEEGTNSEDEDPGCIGCFMIGAVGGGLIGFVLMLVFGGAGLVMGGGGVSLSFPIICALIFGVLGVAVWFGSEVLD